MTDQEFRCGEWELVLFRTIDMFNGSASEKSDGAHRVAVFATMLVEAEEKGALDPKKVIQFLRIWK